MMKCIKTMMILFILITNSMILSGCWNYGEVNDVAIAVGSAIDYDEKEDMLKLTVEVAYPVVGEAETKIKSQIFTSEGENLFDAIRNLIQTSGKKIFWAHAKVIILGERVVKNEEVLISVIDFIKRDAEARSDIWVLLSKEKTAGEILKTETRVQEIVSFELEDIIKNQGSVSKYYGVPLWKFVDNLSSEGISATLPTVKTRKHEDEKMSEIYGTDVFKGTKLVGWLNGSETKSFLFVINEIKGGVLIIGEEDPSKNKRIALEIFKNKTKIKPIYSNGELTMKINVETTVNINELESAIDFTKEEVLKEIQRDGEAYIEKGIKTTIKKAQKEYNSDIFGFGGMIEREMPHVWKEIKDDWDKIFPNIHTEVNAKVNIRGSALRSKPIKVGN